MKRTICILMTCTILTTFCLAQKPKETTDQSTVSKPDSLTDKFQLISVDDINNIQNTVGNQLSTKLLKSEWDLVMNIISNAVQDKVNRLVAAEIEKRKKNEIKNCGTQ